MSSLTIPSTIIQAGNHFANMVKALRPSDPDKGTIIFFRVPNSLKTHKIDMPRQLKYVREAAFFIDKAIKSKEELFFLKCIVYQLSMFYPPAVPLTMETCMALFGALIVEIEWAYWAGRSNLTLDTSWKCFVTYPTPQVWDYFMTPILHAYQQREAQRRAARVLAQQRDGNFRLAPRKKTGAVKIGKGWRTGEDEDSASKGEGDRRVEDRDDASATTTTGTGSQSDPFVLWQPI